LKDDELVSLLIDNKDRIEVILSNTSKARGGTVWDATNKDSRKTLKNAGVTVHDRMFNNNHIGHNKFAVWLDAGNTPRAVMTGSTNWTSTGLCGQSNNSLVVTGDDIAEAYHAYWQLLLDDKFPPPKPPTSAGKAIQKQGPEIRTADQTPTKTTLNGSGVEIWFSPNTDATKKGKDAPPDLAELFDLISKAQQAIFFLAFMPSRAGADSIISASIDAGKADEKLYVVGAISDVTAMPGYVAPDKKGNTQKARDGVKPYTFDSGGTHIVRATAIDSPIGDFEDELLKVGNAIVHDKILVIDPLSDNCVVATGSHNLGFKASYENDENLVIFRGNQALAQAYAIHVLDVYDHYRFRAWQAKEQDEGKPFFEGHINGDDKWLRDQLKRRDISRYFV
jgi:phosphatidylserine/phosphatidylglycerophosphate/cardiolipin synthase-like enzyme